MNELSLLEDVHLALMEMENTSHFRHYSDFLHEVEIRLEELRRDNQ